MIPCTPFTDNDNPTLEILGKTYNLDEVVKFRNLLMCSHLDLQELKQFLSSEIYRVQTPIADKLKITPNHSGMGS